MAEAEPPQLSPHPKPEQQPEVLPAAQPAAASEAVIDLTSDDDPSPTANITPERPNKRSRPSRRCATHRDAKTTESSNVTRKKGNDEDKDDDIPAYEAEHINGYFEIDEILERTTKRFSEKDRVREVAEYRVSWKIPQDYNGPADFYKPWWLPAENLNQHSLARAFKQFPTDDDPDRCSNNESDGTDVELKTPEIEDFVLKEEDFSDDDGDDDESEDECVEAVESDDLQELELGGDGKEGDENEVDPNVSHLENSDYESPGTAELVLNGRTYRIGQSFFNPDKSYIYTISMIHPVPKKAMCLKYMRMSKTFVCPPGEEDSYVLVSEDFVVDLAILKASCKFPFKKFSMRYEQDDENQRAFAYYNETGKILHHPLGRPAVLDLFCGAGGMSLGLEKYFDVKWVVDNDHLAAATLRANKTNSSTQCYTEDLNAFLKKSFHGDPCYPKAGEVDHIHASPPCKGFSRANRNGGKDDMLNNKQTLLFIKAIMLFRPKTVSFENVPGLVLEDFKGYLKSVVSSLLQMKYQIRVQVLSSEKYGDPQKRRRLILLAARSDCKLPEMPAPSHGLGLYPIVTSKDVLWKFEKELPTKSNSCGAVFIGDTIVYNHIIPKYKPPADEYKLVKDEPSRTVLARSRPHVHYNGERFISVREAACLQSFPITYRFYGSLASQLSQVGNAVPVKLSTAIARSVAVVHGCAV